MKKQFYVLLSACFLLTAAACGKAPAPEDCARQLLQEFYTVADHESIEASLGAFETRATQSPWRAQYEALISEAFLDEFCANYVFDYSLAAYDGGYLVEAGDVALQETSSAEDPARRVYSYTLPLTVTFEYGASVTLNGSGVVSVVQTQAGVFLAESFQRTDRGAFHELAQAG